MKNQIFAFDIDGTLIQGGNPLHKESFRYALNTAFQASFDLDWSSVHGSTDKAIIERAVVTNLGTVDLLTSPTYRHIYSLMEDYTRENIAKHPYQAFDSVHQTLRLLAASGCLLGLCTGNIPGISDIKMSSIGAEGYFRFAGYGHNTTDRSDIARHSLIDLQKSGIIDEPIKLDNFYIVGDTPYDIHSALQNGFRAIGIASGVYTHDQLLQAGADNVFDKFEELLELTR